MSGEDFYFELLRQVSGNVFLITPKAYYDKEGCLSDKSGVADGILPAGFFELAESTFEFDGTPEGGRQLLLNLGMKEIKLSVEPGEPSSKGFDEEGNEEEDDDLDMLLAEGEEIPDAFDYKNIPTDKLMRHLSIMVSTEAFEEAAKIQAELNSRNS